ncbi:dipeptide transport system ATP-binding protein [Pseudoalteromonas ulvae UL12]|uniref:Peptide ABC transporter ATP-binding protein n=1 Tax=Pseudoalteromonas ulvae TaxID=107327 RepID=A0A244CS53_PSEDV|nr:ATP-binding cassette domain-containing protein [Pseudoalteromonas ulvae]MBE0363568.1 dipeptide transport system ATP-binding protein [Pseudoalteromonas ulvae UL12]OUL58433.1 peptide ABC transporter ATP-binding protein [Pseudoalteromonas ulvae]
MQPVLKVQALSKEFNVRAGMFRSKKLKVLSDISFCLNEGQTIAIIGETGSGKSTLAKILAGAERCDTGQILLEGHILEDGGHRQPNCRDIRLIFQSPASSLNPSSPIGKMLNEILLHNTELSHTERKEKINTTLLKVGLLSEHKLYYPHMFSGGQLQRVALARALILDPKVVVLDEALSALDPSVRAQTVNLLLKLQRESNLSYVLITHHLSLVKHMSDSIVVLDHGHIVECGETHAVFADPQSKITQRLLNC